MRDANELQMNVERAGDVVIIEPVGEVDLSSSMSLRQLLIEVQATKPQRLIIDLQQVPHMDSSGVATLIEAMQTARREKHQLVLCGLQDRVRSVFEIAKLDMVFTIVENADKARSV